MVGKTKKGFTDFPLYHTEGNVLVCYGELSFILFQLVGPEADGSNLVWPLFLLANFLDMISGKDFSNLLNYNHAYLEKKYPNAFLVRSL